MRSRIGTRAAVGLTAIALSASGCNWVVPLAVATQNVPTKKVPAEFSKLAGKRAMVLVWAEPDVLFDYPNVRLELSSYVTDHIKAHVSNVRFVPPREVEEYIQRQNAEAQDPTEVGRYFDVDLVIHVVLLEFSMRDREMAHYYRGRARASVTVYDMVDASGSPQRYLLSEVYVVYPQDRPVGFDASHALIVRQKTYEAFADGVGRKFYAYEMPA